MKVLVTGGARSGKSAFAERYAAKLAPEGIYIATAQAYDDEMRQRIEQHRQERAERGFRWTTREEPYDLAGALRELAAQQRPEAGPAPGPAPAAEESGRLGRVVLVDCLTLWLSNRLLEREGEAEAERRVEALIEELAQAFADYSGALVLVTNEVGYGLVPEYKLGRQFRDLSGRMNQRLAQAADQVFLVTAGIPIELKSRQYLI